MLEWSLVGEVVFIINLILLYVLVLLITGRYSMRLYVAYNCTYIFGMLLALQLHFVEFQHVQSSEHMVGSSRQLLSDRKMFQAFLRITATCVVGVGVVSLGVGTTSGYIPPCSSMEKVYDGLRFLSL
ncbi:hypothetical protein CerSpe_070110 [Prunus speciosa]